jgi:hypothetical protein
MSANLNYHCSLQKCREDSNKEDQDCKTNFLKTLEKNKENVNVETENIISINSNKIYKFFNICIFYGCAIIIIIIVIWLLICFNLSLGIIENREIKLTQNCLEQMFQNQTKVITKVLKKCIKNNNSSRFIFVNNTLP